MARHLSRWSWASFKQPENHSFLPRSIQRHFSSTKPSGWRRRRFYRRSTIFAVGFTAWYFMVDADFITYSLDLYQRNQERSPIKQIESLTSWNEKRNKTFCNKTIWIIGASSGIGEYIAYNLCSLDTNAPKRIIISARRVEELNRVANHCNILNPMIDVMVKPLDITDFSQNDIGDEYIGSIFDEIDDDIDILVLNSGLIQKCRAEYASMESFKGLAEINMYGPIAFTQSMVKQWRFRGHTKKQRNKRHQIAVTSSFVGKVGSPGYAFYSLTKHGVNGFFESLRVELQDDGIDFNIMCLGPVLPSKGTHPEMGGRKDVEYIRNYTDKYGNIITLERCAQLYVSALRHSVSESWITVNPYLFYMYARQYIPALALPLSPVFGNSYKREVQNADKGIYES